MFRHTDTGQRVPGSGGISHCADTGKLRGDLQMKESEEGKPHRSSCLWEPLTRSPDPFPPARELRTSALNYDSDLGQRMSFGTRVVAKLFSRVRNEAENKG